MTTDNADGTIAFQGVAGAYSDLACREVFPDMTTLPRENFDDAFEAVREGRARLAMIPIDNSVAGRVADIHHLLPAGGLKIVGEHFQRVRHQLLVLPEAEIGDIAHVHSHIHALDQCRKLRRELGLKAVVHADTAGAAAMVLDMGDKTRAAIGSELAAEIHGLKILRSDIEDAEHNTTRFLIMAREAEIPAVDENDCVTSFVFRVRNVPAALFKCLGGFATNGVNMSKLESYMADGKFVAARFYAEVDGHPDRRDTRLALEELDFHSEWVRILGVYPAHPFRKSK